MHGRHFASMSYVSSLLNPKQGFLPRYHIHRKGADWLRPALGGHNMLANWGSMHTACQCSNIPQAPAHTILRVRRRATDVCLSRRCPGSGLPAYFSDERSWHRPPMVATSCQKSNQAELSQNNKLPRPEASSQQESPQSTHTTVDTQSSSTDTGTSNNSSQSSQPQGQQELSPVESSAAEVDRKLAAVWEDLKSEMRKEADPETARLLESISYEELTGSNAMHFFRKLADAQLGPILSSMGITEDPFEFFVEVIKIGTFIQFVTCGMVWYGSQGLGHAEVAGIATAGIALGYLTRPAFKVEQLLFPVYNAILQGLMPNASYVVTPSTREQVQGTLNSIGVTLAVAFLLPRALWGWDTSDSTAFVLPLTMGWFLFDLTYLGALLLQLRRGS